MIISRTPLRISFFGGGSDLPAFYCDEPGAVLTTTVDKYIYIMVNRRFGPGIRVSYSATETVDCIDELKHELVRESLRLVGISDGVEITSISEIPSSGSGMGSSSAYTVGMLNALHTFAGTHTGADQLAGEACRIEIDLCDKPIGKQDQYIAAYGGLQYVQFNPDGTVFVDPVLCSPATKARLHERLLLFYTGITRSANPILESQKANTASCEETRTNLRAMAQMARTMVESLRSGRIDDFGDMLHESWMRKRQLASSISNPRIDEWYETARRCGAAGGKLLGAGGGGFLLFFAEPEYHHHIAEALGNLMHIPFQFEPQGSKIVFIDENYSNAGQATFEFPRLASGLRAA